MLLGDLIALNARKTPNRTALISGTREHTFGYLHGRCNRVANAMLGLAQPGDRIAILAENIPEYVECYYGVPAAGMALTFLNYRLAPREWAWILGHADARVLVIEERFLELLAPELEGLADLRTVVVIGGSGRQVVPGVIDYEDLLAAARPTPPGGSVDEDSTAWLIYTSGTTGFPKGAMLSHRSLLTAALASIIEYQPQPDERFLMAFPLCHVAGYATSMYMLRGGCVVLTPSFEPEQWMQLVERHRITAGALAPTMVNFVLNHPSFGRYELGSLRNLAYGAAPMPVEVLKQAIDRLGPIVYTGFGMTETAGNLLHHSKEVHLRALRGEEHLLAACGKPVCLADAIVVDADMNECPPGVVGEIVMRGEQLLTGYLRDEQATAAAFAGGWFHSGDLASRDEEGFFSIVDRIKDMIVTGGENVYSREVEEAIYADPDVSEAAVIGLPDPTWGENVTAVVVLRPGVDSSTVKQQEIIDVCRNRLAGYKKPKRVIFVDELPKTVSGKTIKRELRDRYR